jgi:NAD(P)H-flavin reductase
VIFQIRNPQSHMFPIDLSITRIGKHTRAIWSFFMVPRSGARPEFKAGQVAVLRMGDCNDTYIAFASAPEDDEFEFLIKHVPEPAGLSGALFDPRSENQVVLKNIVGRGFPVENHKGHDLVFVAMGGGLAPLRSTLRHLSRSREDYGRLVVLYGARTVDDFCFGTEMTTEWREQGVELRQVLSQPNGDWSGPTGYVQSLLDNISARIERPRRAGLRIESDDGIEEIRVHLRLETQEQTGAGLSPEEARYAAHRSFGGVLLTTERSRDRIQLRLRVSRNVLHPVINRAKEIFYNVFGLHESIQENGFSRHTFHVRLL